LVCKTGGLLKPIQGANVSLLLVCPILRAWRFTMDIGSAGAPVLLSAVTALSGLVTGAAAFGVVGLVGAVLLARFIPRQLPRDEG